MTEQKYESMLNWRYPSKCYRIVVLLGPRSIYLHVWYIICRYRLRISSSIFQYISDYWRHLTQGSPHSTNSSGSPIWSDRDRHYTPYRLKREISYSKSDFKKFMYMNEIKLLSSTQKQLWFSFIKKKIIYWKKIILNYYGSYGSKISTETWRWRWFGLLLELGT